MFDNEIASNVLYNDLKNQRIYKKTFEEFINERKTEIGNSYNISYEQILNIIKEDINRISADELFELIYYLDKELVYGKYYEEYQENRNVKNITYERYGINLLYELPGTTSCSSYMFQYGNFTHHYPIEEIKLDEDDQGQNIDVRDFLKFNDYIILLMKLIIDEECEKNDLNENEKLIMQQTVLQYNDEKKFSEIIQNEFSFIMKEYQQDKNDGCATVNTVYAVHEFITQSIEMKLRINPKKNTRIIIVDSW